MADLSALAKVTEFFASGATRRDGILRRYGAASTLPSGAWAKGAFEASPITYFEDPRTDQRQASGGGAELDATRTFYTLARLRGPDEFAPAEGDEIVAATPEAEDFGTIYQVVRLTPWRDGSGDEVTVQRVGKVGHAPY